MMSTNKNYQPCPCGSGEVIKRCCKEREVAAELQKIMQLEAAEQHAAARARMNQLLTKHPEHPCALGLQLQMLVGDDPQSEDPSAEADFDEIERVSSRLLELQPLHTNALAARVMSEVARAEGLPETTQTLETLLARVGANGLTSMAFVALNVMVRAAFEAGRWLTAIAILTARDRLLNDMGENDNALAAFRSERNIAPLLKMDWMAWLGTMNRSNENVPEFDEGWDMAHAGRWTEAQRTVRQLLETRKDRPECYGLIAYTLSVQGYDDKALAWWEQMSAHPALDPKDAIVLDLLLQRLKTSDYDDAIARLELEIPVSDFDAFQEKLLASKRIAMSPVDPSTVQTSDDGPPPRNVFQLLDRDKPAADEIPKRVSEVPGVLALGLLYGKETDRDARVRMMVWENEESEAVEALNAIVGTATEVSEREEVGKESRLAHALEPRLLNVEGAGAVKQTEWVHESARKFFMEQWSSFPNPLLQGVSPRDAGDSSDTPEQRKEAIVLDWMCMAPQWGYGWDVQQIRRQAGLMPQAPIALEDIRPLEQWWMLPYVEWRDVALADLLMAAAAARMIRFDYGFARIAAQALQLLEEAMKKSESVDNEDAKKAQSMMRLMISELGATDQARDLCDRLEAVSKHFDLPLGQLMVDQWVIQIGLQDFEAADASWSTIRLKYMDDPAVESRVYEILHRLGVINPDGTPREAVGAAAGGEMPAPAMGGGAVEPLPGGEGGGLWTPDSADPAGEAPKKLWIPGQD